MTLCKCGCGCGETVKRGRTFVNKEHQLQWMVAGGASEMNAIQPLEAKVKGGHTQGQRSYESGKLREAGEKGAAVSREIAERFRERSALEQDTPNRS